MVGNTSITVFNKFYDKVTKREVLHATYFDSAFWHAGHSVSINSGGMARAYRVVVRIVERDQSGFVESDLYDGTAGTWTIKNGDLVTKGDKRHLIKSSDVTALEDTFVIKSWTDNRRGYLRALRHWKIEGE